jgi:hypothetical protein
VGEKYEQTPGMASSYGIGLRGNLNILLILAYSGSIRDKVKDNSMAIKCAVAASHSAHGIGYGNSHPVLRCNSDRCHLWYLGLSPNVQRAAVAPFAIMLLYTHTLIGAKDRVGQREGLCRQWAA